MIFNGVRVRIFWGATESWAVKTGDHFRDATKMIRTSPPATETARTAHRPSQPQIEALEALNAVQRWIHGHATNQQNSRILNEYRASAIIGSKTAAIRF